MGTMMAKDSVRTRMESEQGISFTEFTYQLLQVGAAHAAVVWVDVGLVLRGSGAEGVWC